MNQTASVPHLHDKERKGEFVSKTLEKAFVRVDLVERYYARNSPVAFP